MRRVSHRKLAAMSEASDQRLYYPHVARNREPIVEVLRRVLPPQGLVLEVASGSGEHAVYFAQKLPALFWQPTDPDERALASIAAHRAAAAVPNMLPPLHLDVLSERWPVERADAVICNNMIHIAPWSACEGLIAGAERVLPESGLLYLYGPYKIDGRHTAPSNQAFDAQLRSQNAAWGIRDLDDVKALAERDGFALAETVRMPANNLSVIFRRGA
jgi:SAM-dependent methyltransferase